MEKYVFILSLATFFLARGLSAEAQEPGKTWKIGVLVSGTASVNATRDEALRTGLRQFRL